MGDIDDWARSRIEALQQRLAELEERVAILDNRQPSWQAAAVGIDPQIVTLAQSGQTIQAIKLYRERTGVGLAEAKAAVERILG